MEEAPRLKSRFVLLLMACLSTPLGCLRTPPPPTSAPSLAKCSATPQLSRAGDRKIALHVEVQGAHGPIEWATNAGTGLLDHATGSATAHVDTASLSDGTYTAQASVPLRRGGLVQCTANFTISRSAPLLGAARLTSIVTALLPAGEPENPDFAFYTYVLLRKRPTDPDDVLRLHNLVKGLVARGMPENFGQPATEGETLPPPPPGNTNRPRPVHVPAESLGIVFIPVETPYPASYVDDAIARWVADDGHYSPESATAMLGRLACQSAKPSCSQKLSGDGPFLVSTMIRLGAENNQPTSAFIQDLSGTTPDTADQWVGKFLDIVSTQSQWNTLTLQRTMLNMGTYFDRGGKNLFKARTSWKDVSGFFTIFGLHVPGGGASLQTLPIPWVPNRPIDALAADGWTLGVRPPAMLEVPAEAN